MIFNALKSNIESKNEFFNAFDKVFKNKHISKWKYKFYLKAYSNPVFKILLFIKNQFIFD